MYRVIIGVGVAILFLMVVSSSGTARERDFLVGINFNTPYFFEPQSVVGDTSVNLHGEIFFADHFSIIQQLEFGVNGFLQRSYVAGVKGYLMPYHELTPFLGAQGVLQYNPRMDGGIRGSVGVQWDLTDRLGLAHISTFFETNFGILFRQPASAVVDIYRIGILYGF